jgi:hypothetical protein
MRSTTTRRAAIVAVVGLLVGGSVGLGALVAVAQPNAIAFTTTSGNVVGPWPGVNGTVDWTDGGSGGSITVAVTNSAGTTTCTTDYLATEETWNCLPPLEYGTNTITATATETDDPGNPLSTAAPIVITYGGTQSATITSPPDTSSSSTAATFSGTAAQMGSVTLRARPVGSSDPGDFVDICAPAPVDAAGNWSCVASFPERRIWTVQAQSVTLTGLDYGPPATQTFTFDNERPDTTVVSTPGLLRLDATPGATGSTVSTVWRYFADAADTGSVVATCPAAASQACAVPGTPLAGLYLASSNAYANDAGSSDRGDFVRIPAAPVITGTDESVPGQLSVAGTFDTTFSEPFGQVTGDGTPVVDILDADSSVVLCGDIELAPSGDWNCTTAAPAGTFDYVAVARTSTPIGTSNAQDVFSPGTSARSNVVTTTVDPIVVPDLVCSFGPASASISSPHPMGVYRLYPGFESGSGWFYDLADQALCNGASGTTFPNGTEFEGFLVTSCDPDCTPSGLEPGWYEVYVESGDGFSYIFTVPETPVFAATASSGSNVITTGTGTPQDRVQVQRTDGGVLCSTTVSASGAWACTFPRSSATSARVIAIDPSSGGMSSYSAARSIPVRTVQLPTEAPTEVPVAALTWLLQFGGDLTKLKPGDTFTVSIDGMPSGWTIEMWMHSTPQLLGATTATGAPMTMTLTVPENIESGAHEIEMVATTPNGTSYFERTDAMVLSSSTTDGTPAEDAPTDDEAAAGGTGGGAGSADRADAAAPSALSDALAPISAIVANPGTLAVAGGFALALLFLVALPTELLNSSLSSNTSRLGRAYGAVDSAMTRAQDWLIRVTRSRAIAAGILVVIVAIIYGFVDPRFGFDLVSLRLVLSLALAFFLLSFVASWISGMIIRRAWGAMGVVAMQPSIILFAIVGVVVARVLEFSPGFLVGIAIGLELVQASKTVVARAVFVQLGVVTGLALAAWIAYSLFTPGDDFAGMLVEDTLVAVTAEGLTGALIAVFPLTFLDGRELWEVSKRLWAAAFLIVATAFSLLVLPTAIEATDVGDYGVWLLVFAVFGLVSLAVWLVFARAERRAARADAEKVDA